MANTPAKTYTAESITRKLRSRFVDGRWPLDRVIPSENELSAEFRVCRATVVKSLKELEREGLLRSHKGKGRYVNQTPTKPKTWCLGLLIMDMQSLLHPVVSRQIEGIRSVMGDSNYHLKIFAHNAASRVTLRNVGPGVFLGIVDVAGIDGLILMTHWVSDEQAVDLACQIPVVWMLHSDLLPKVWGVTQDTAGGMYDAMHHLLDLGHRDIGLITLGDHVAQGRDQQAGAKLAMRPMLKENNGTLTIGLAEYNSPAEGLRVARQMLDAPQRPTALLAGSDDLAIGILQAAKERDLSIPGDLSIVGWNDVLTPQEAPVPMTTVVADYFALGQASAKRMLAMLDNPEQPGPCPDISTRFIVRQSTAPPPKTRKPVRATSNSATPVSNT